MPGNKLKVGDLVISKFPTSNLHPSIIYKVVKIFSGKYPVLVNENDPEKQYVILSDNLQKIDDFKLTVYHSNNP